MAETSAGSLSPILYPVRKFEASELIDPAEDDKMRRQVIDMLKKAHGGEVVEPDEGEKAFLESERRKGMGDNEAGFNARDDSHGEVLLDNKHYEWEDKYRPRKPRFFNRVKTGYAWNKYNQTHYDHDNPPPKMVQGYKFNVFYPDLIDKTKAPTYNIEKSDTPDTVLLRFMAGPPYEDVAFKIVNKEWNTLAKFGFRCVFDRGVLQLYFNFKRHLYR